MACISMEGDTLSLLKFNYQENNENNQFTEIIIDELNELETVKIYHFNK
jgi:TATA-binding protein-associated factor Taf7